MKMKTVQWMLACFVAVSVLSLALPGFAENSALQVTCLDSSGNPLQNVKVVVFCLNNQKDKNKNSDAQGAAEFLKLDDGVYRVYGRKAGFAPALYEFAQLKGSKETVALKFAAGADKKLWFEDKAEEQKAGDFMKQAFEAYKKNDFAEAEKLYGQALEIVPSDGNALLYLAVSCLQQGKFDRGVEMLNRTSAVTSALKSLSSGSNSYEQVYQNAQQLLHKIPSLKGEMALRQKNYDEAAADFSEAVKGDPNNPDNYANLAIALTNAKKFDEALTALDKANQLKPGAYDDLKKQISARKENAEIDKAQAVMDDGRKLLAADDAAGAMKKFEEAKSMVPPERQSPVWSQIAKAQLKLNQPDAAVAAFKKAIELAPERSVSVYRDEFEQYYLNEKKCGEALEIFTDPKAAGSKSPEEIMLDKSKAWKDRNLECAEAALERAIKTNPGNAETYFQLGQMYYADGKAKDSRTKDLLTKYVEIGKDAGNVDNAKNMLVIVNRRSK